MLMLCQGLLDKVEHGLWGALSSGTWLSCIHVNIFFLSARSTVLRDSECQAVF